MQALKFARFWAFIAVGALLCPQPTRAEVYFGVRELLTQQFKDSTRVSFVKVRPSGAQRALIEHRLGHPLEKSEYIVYVAKTGEHTDGYAIFDDERGQHELISFATFFTPEGGVARVEIVAYREPFGDGVRATRFLRQFVGRSANSGFAIDRDIDVISGATISSRSIARGIARTTLLLRELVLAQEAEEHASR